MSAGEDMATKQTKHRVQQGRGRRKLNCFKEPDHHEKTASVTAMHATSGRDGDNTCSPELMRSTAVPQHSYVVEAEAPPEHFALVVNEASPKLLAA